MTAKIKVFAAQSAFIATRVHFVVVNIHSAATKCSAPVVDIRGRRFASPYYRTTAVFSCFHIPPAARPTILGQMAMGCLTCAPNVGLFRAHEVGSGTKKSAQDLTRKDRKTAPHPAPVRGSNPGSSDYIKSDALATELRPPSIYTTELWWIIQGHRHSRIELST